MVKMHCSFHTKKKKLFLVINFLAGVEMFLRLGREGIFLEAVVRFYVGEILLALERLHSRSILHWNLKPENIRLGTDRHFVLTDRTGQGLLMGHHRQQQRGRLRPNHLQNHRIHGSQNGHA